MKKVIFIGLLVLAVALSGCVEDGAGPGNGGVGNGGNGPTLEEMQVCSVDEDCIIVERDCCPCTAGGGRVSINKNFLQQYNEEFLEICKVIDIACPLIMSNDPICSENAVPACVQGKCSFVIPEI